MKPKTKIQQKDWFSKAMTFVFHHVRRIPNTATLSDGILIFSVFFSLEANTRIASRICICFVFVKSIICRAKILFGTILMHFATITNKVPRLTFLAALAIDFPCPCIFPFTVTMKIKRCRHTHLHHCCRWLTECTLNKAGQKNRDWSMNDSRAKVHVCKTKRRQVCSAFTAFAPPKGIFTACLTWRGAVSLMMSLFESTCSQQVVRKVNPRDEPSRKSPLLPFLGLKNSCSVLCKTGPQ